MDFFKLLKNKPKTDETIELPKVEHPVVDIKEVIDKKDDYKRTNINDRSKYENKNTNDVSFYNLQQIEFKKGENIMVIKFEDSPLNYYKGYIGIIRTSLKSSDTCMITLDALNSGAAIRFPKKHLVKWCPYTNTQL